MPRERLRKIVTEEIVSIDPAELEVTAVVPRGSGSADWIQMKRIAEHVRTERAYGRAFLLSAYERIGSARSRAKAITAGISERERERRRAAGETHLVGDITVIPMLDDGSECWRGLVRPQLNDERLFEVYIVIRNLVSITSPPQINSAVHRPPGVQAAPRRQM